MNIPGWNVALEEGLYTATREAPLTGYQERYGALAEVDARDADELVLLVSAQATLTIELERAERLDIERRRRGGLRSVR